MSKLFFVTALIGCSSASINNPSVDIDSGTNDAYEDEAMLGNSGPVEPSNSYENCTAPVDVGSNCNQAGSFCDILAGHCCGTCQNNKCCSVAGMPCDLNQSSCCNGLKCGIGCKCE